MYIHHTSTIIQRNSDIKTYRTQLKELCSINLRRSSKFNILAVYGALLCTSKRQLSDNSAIYVSTEYGAISELNHVLESSYDEQGIVMPFDFLNINTNNVGFYVSKALEAMGKNMVITLSELSFEKALQLAKFDLQTHEVKDVLIGGVDESLECIENYEHYIHNVLNYKIMDSSCWVYANNEQKGALASIDTIEETNDILEVKKWLSSSKVPVVLNSFAQVDKPLQPLLKEYDVLPSSSFYGYHTFLEVLKSIKKYQAVLYIAKDNSDKYMGIRLSQ